MGRRWTWAIVCLVVSALLWVVAAIMTLLLAVCKPALRTVLRRLYEVEERATP